MTALHDPFHLSVHGVVKLRLRAHTDDVTYFDLRVLGVGGEMACISLFGNVHLPRLVLDEALAEALAIEAPRSSKAAA